MDAIISLLNPSNTLTVNRPLAHSIGTLEALVYAALLAKYAYYQRNNMLTNGWFYSTAPDLEESTGLSEKQQARCIANLVGLKLIETQKKGMPAKRSFRIINNVELIKNLLADGEDKMNSIKPNATRSYEKKRQGNSACSAKTAEQANINEAHPSAETAEQKSTNVGICSDETAEHAQSNCSSMHAPIGGTCSAGNSEYIKETKNNKSKENESKIIYQSINHTFRVNDALQTNTENMTDMIDTSTLHSIRQGTSIEKRNECQERIRNNIDYDELVNDKRGLKCEIDNIIAIMTDVICSGAQFVHVNGEEQPHEVVEERFYKLTYDDIDYVLNAIQRKANKINNIRSYLITALFNSHATQSIGAFAEACAEM